MLTFLFFFLLLLHFTVIIDNYIIIIGTYLISLRFDTFSRYFLASLQISNNVLPLHRLRAKNGAVFTIYYARANTLLQSLQKTLAYSTIVLLAVLTCRFQACLAILPSGLLWVWLTFEWWIMFLAQLYSSSWSSYIS